MYLWWLKLSNEGFITKNLLPRKWVNYPAILEGRIVDKNSISLLLVLWSRSAYYTLIEWSETWFSDLIEAFAAHVSHIVATLATKWYATCQVAAQPTAYNTSAPLAARCFKPRPCLSLFSAVRTFYCLRGPFGIYSWYTLVLFQLFSAQKLGKFFLSCVLSCLGLT